MRHDSVSIVLKSKPLDDDLIVVYFLILASVSSGYPSDYVTGDKFCKIEDGIFGMRLIFIDDSFGIRKESKSPEGNRGL